MPDFKGKRFCDHACYSASLKVSVTDRFWSKVNKKTASGCWLWTGATTKGYGQISGALNGKKRPLYAHRVSWEIAHGPVPDGLSVLHNCPTGDNPLCVNPAHLFLGTQPENLADARAKGRLIDGLHARKLSDAAYHEILTAPPRSGRMLMQKYGVTKTTISRIRHGKQGSTYGKSASGPLSHKQAS